MKKGFIFIICLISLIFVISATCTDTDQGINVFERGNMIDYNLGYDYTDYCLGDDKLVEFYCDPGYHYVYEYCSNYNTVCENGACVGAAPPTPDKCSDGTSYGQCSSTKPKYCDNGNLINKCQVCGCPSSQTCKVDGSCTPSLEVICTDSSRLGDANNDGIVTYEDYILIFSIYNGSIQPPSNLCCVDLNKDGKVTREDSDLAYDVYAGKKDLGRCSKQTGYTLIGKNCTDSDNGKNYSIKGTIQITYTNGAIRIENDSCNSDGTLREWFCGTLGDPAGLLRSENYVTCPSNTKCKEGACVSEIEPDICSDGTSYGQCSKTKPKYCDNGNLIDNCTKCGCDPNYECQGLICVESTSERWTNPTAPNDLIKYLSGDFTDTDGDGMTDVAEIKYGFDPQDMSSFPSEPEVIILEQFLIDGSGIEAYYEIGFDELVIKWENPDDGTYSLSLKTKGSDEWNIYYGGHYVDYATVSFMNFGLDGTETLIGHFSKYASDRSFVEQYPDFEIDLSQIKFPNVSEIIGNPSNRISYTFSDDFPADAETQYREFLKRVFPIIYKYLGPPAENFNTYIKNMGEDTGWFMIVDDGRTFLTDTKFIPRLITHEFVHAWKGNFIMASNENWEYDTKLNGFEEATAEGMAFEIIHEYVRSYPNDSATIQLLSWKPYQYWSSRTTFYDSIKHNRNTGAGEFWNPPSLQTNRYSIAATTLQMMVRENPNFMKEFMLIYFKKIKENPSWRPNREDIINMWENLVPNLNGYPLDQYLNSLPVFNGRKLDGGIYVLDEIRTYGLLGDQQFAVGYALPENGYSFNQDGMVWWGIYENELNTLPEWIKTSKGEDGFYYPDTQNSSFIVEVRDTYGNNYATYNFKTKWERYPDGHPTGFGWYYAEELKMEKFPLGLYKEIITFTDYIDYDQGAKDTFYFFGLKEFEQDREKDYVIMIGIDGVSEGTAEISINGKKYTSPIQKGVAIFKSIEWRFDIQGKFPITITDTNGISKQYYRTIIESGTYHNYFQQQFIIVDKNFNGVEDEFE